MFGGLMRSCIRDDYKKESSVLTEGVVVMLLGLASSVLTTYVLASLGLFV